MLRAMVQALLNKQPLRRPCCEQLLQHPFLCQETKEAKEAKAGPSLASKASQDDAATRDGLKLARECSTEKDGTAPMKAALGRGHERGVRGQGGAQPSLTPSSALYAHLACLTIGTLPSARMRLDMLSRCEVTAEYTPPLVVM